VDGPKYEIIEVKSYELIGRNNSVLNAKLLGIITESINANKSYNYIK
jgi:hypothetical protein